MNRNIGGLDRGIRIIGGVLLMVAAITGVFAPWGWIGVVPFLTGVLGWCPAYSLFGLDSCPLSTKKHNGG